MYFIFTNMLIESIHSVQIIPLVSTGDERYFNRCLKCVSHTCHPTHFLKHRQTWWIHFRCDLHKTWWNVLTMLRPEQVWHILDRSIRASWCERLKISKMKELVSFAAVSFRHARAQVFSFWHFLAICFYLNTFDDKLLPVLYKLPLGLRWCALSFDVVHCFCGVARYMSSQRQAVG